MRSASQRIDIFLDAYNAHRISLEHLARVVTNILAKEASGQEEEPKVMESQIDLKPNQP